MKPRAIRQHRDSQTSTAAVVPLPAMRTRKSLTTWLGVWAALTTVIPAFAQLEILPAEQSPAVFGGDTRLVQVVFRNSGEGSIKTALKTRLFQLSSATRMPVGEAEAWKKLTVLGGQTVLETIRLKCPDVRTTTRFEIRWLDDADKAIGQTLVMVYPTNQIGRASCRERVSSEV